MNASLPPASGDISQLIALLKDPNAAKLIEEQAKIKSEIAANIKENEAMLEALKKERSEMKVEKERLLNVRTQAYDAVKHGQALMKESEVREKKAAEALFVAEKAKAEAEAILSQASARATALRAEAEELLLKAKAEAEYAAGCKQKYQHKLDMLKAIIKED